MHNDRKIKRETTFGDDVLHALRDFRAAIQRGERITVRTVKLDLTPRKFSAQAVVALRHRLGVSQAIFAQFVAVSPKLVQHWEQGTRVPGGTARRLMEEIDIDPNRWLTQLTRRRRAS